ncbi:MAG: DUF1116 domain-containing protein [Legionella sp.]|nr:DUF1116 domain-containing protein [Legionella sp.]
MTDKTIDQQNAAVIAALHNARPRLIGLARAGDVIPELDNGLVLHAGPPIAWVGMSPAMQAAVAGGLVFEGKTKDLEEAAKIAGSGDIRYAPAHDYRAAGAMAGIITAGMPVFIFEDETSGERAYVTINEGLGKTLRFGANGPDVISRLQWLRDRFAPLLQRAMEINGPMDLKQQVMEALRRGDECHNRNKAATSGFIRAIGVPLVETGAPHADISEALRFIGGNDHFFLSLSIGHAKTTTLAMEAVGGGSLVTTMAGNGREVGIRVSNTAKKWFTAPAEVADVRLFAGQAIADATPTMGDSYVTEVIGLGAFALAAAPAIAEFIGGTVQDLIERSESMRAICISEHPHFLIPALAFRGTPCGIDVRKVVATGLAPLVNTGVASRIPGAGQIGAGTQRLPLACFRQANAALEN